MNHDVPTIRLRTVLWSGIKWVPIVALPFAAVFAEVHWQLQIYANDYESGEIGKRIDELTDQISALEAAADGLKTMELIEARAPDMGFVEAEPHQIERVHTKTLGLGDRGQ